MRIALWPRSRLPGRIRWEVPALREVQGLAGEVEPLLLAEPDVFEVRANGLTGRLLVRYIPSRASSPDLTPGPTEQEAALTARVEAVLAAALLALESRAAAGGRRPADGERDGEGLGAGGGEDEDGEAAGAAARLATAGAAIVGGSLVVGSVLAVSPLIVALSATAVTATVLEVAKLVRRPADASAPGAPAGALLQAEREAAAPARRAITAGAALGVTAVALSLSRFLVIGGAVNLVVERAAAYRAGRAVPGFLARLFGLAGAGLGLTALQALAQFAGQRLWRRAAQSIQHRLQVRLYEHAQALPMAHFEGRDRGAVLAVLYQEIHYVEELFGGAWELLRIGANTALIGTAFFVVAPEIAWIAILTIPLLLRSSAVLQRRLVPLYETAAASAGLLAKHVSGNIEGMATIKALNAERAAAARVAAASREYRERSGEANDMGAAFGPLVELETMGGTVATMVGGGLLTARRQLSPGTYSSLIMLMGQLFWPLTELGRILETLQRALASSARVHALLALPVERSGPPVLLPRRLRGEIEFRDVHFAYPGEAPVLAGLSLHAEPGSRIAVVGATGSGKSTLVKLLLRFYDVDQGAILLDGRDIRTLDLHELRRSIGAVTQEAMLFPGTVRDNIALGSGGADSADRPGSAEGTGEPGLAAVAAAARRAAAADFIARLPAGFDTRIGVRGEALSGGQRQRIALARLFLRNPPVAVLDEATSHVDNKTEAAIARSLYAAFRGRTSIVIAHRLSAVRHADRIFVLAGGRVREQGVHGELLARRGIYAALWRLQTGAADGRRRGGAP